MRARVRACVRIAEANRKREAKRQQVNEYNRKQQEVCIDMCVDPRTDMCVVRRHVQMTGASTHV